MSRLMKCPQCSTTFTAPPESATCARCGAAPSMADGTSAAKRPTGPPSKPPLTDDDVLAFLGPAPAKKSAPKS
jgi:hypothetical protein